MSRKTTKRHDAESNKTFRATVADKEETTGSPAERKTTGEDVSPRWLGDSTKAISTPKANDTIGVWPRECSKVICRYTARRYDS